MRTFIATIIFLATLTAGAQTARVLSYSQWKAQQINEAQNRLTRLSNKLTLIKSDQRSKQPVKPLEIELQGASQSLEIAREYTIDHYVATYLNTFADSRESLLELSQITPKEEMADLLAAILKLRPSSVSALAKPPIQAF